MALTPYLHTSYKYVSPNINLAGFNIEKNTSEQRASTIIQKIIRLEEKEQEFYKQYNCQNEEDFFNTIRSFFKVSPNDKRVFARFNNANLRQYLFDMMGKEGGAIQASEVEIIFKKCPAINIGEILKKAGSGANLIAKYSGGDLILTGEWETGKIRSIFNRINENNNKWDKIKNKNELVNYLLNTEDVVIYQFGRDISHDETLDLRLNHPLSKTSNEINNMSESAVKELSNRLDKLFKTLTAGASAELLAATHEVWKEKFGNAKAALSFFSGGENWLRDAMGAFGEFQLTVFLRYLSKKAEKNNLQSLVRLVGNEYSIYAQQKHTDVELLNSLNGVDIRYGFQSKNFQGFQDAHGNIRRIEIKLHPTEIRGLAGTEEATYIINSYFNESFPQDIYQDFLVNFFYNNITDFLNLEYFEDDYSIPDKVSFYFIAGRLIPGSVLLKKAFAESAEGVKVNTPILSGTKSGKDDSAYKNEKARNPYDNNEMDALFLQYWMTPEGGEPGSYEPTPKNNLVFWNRQVSIRTTFTYGGLWLDARYNLFG